LVTELHDESLRRSLAASADFALAVREGRYVTLNITELLSRVVVYGQPSPMRFLNAAEDAFAEAARRATRQHSKVAVCGEGSAAVWAQGHIEVAIQLEHLWDEVARSRQMDVLCAYPIAVRQEKGPAVRSLCAEHTAVEIS